MRFNLTQVELFFAAMLASTLTSSGEGDSLTNRENLRYGPAFIDDDKQSVLYSELDKTASKIKINKLSDLLKVWSSLSSGNRKERHIAAAAIREHLKQNGIAIEGSIVVIGHDPQSEKHKNLVEELKLKLELIWGFKK